MAKQDIENQEVKETLLPSSGDNKKTTPSDESMFSPESLRVGGLFLLWWAINIGYNCYNKYTLNAARLPWIVGLVQMFAGVPYSFFMWGTGMRPTPKLSMDDIKKLFPIAMCHLLTHVGAVMAMSAGSVSFAHIVKSCEPVFSAVFAGLFLGTFFSWQVYITLLPIVGGVAYASVSELNFTMYAFGTAMMSNTFSALRGVYSKKAMGKDAFTPEQNMNATNLFGVLTIISFITMTPMALYFEFSELQNMWPTIQEDKSIYLNLVLSSIFYYGYNEVAYLVLDKVHPVTHAVGNTIKRVAVIVSSIFIFKTPVSAQGWTGAAIAITGTLLYSLAAKTWKKTYKCVCVSSN